MALLSVWPGRTGGAAGSLPRAGCRRLGRDRGRLRLGRHDRLIDRHGGDDELPGRVDEIVEADHDRDEEEIAALEDQPEAAAGLEGLFLDEGLFAGPGQALVPLRAGPPDVAAVDRPGQDDTEEERDPGDEHELELPAPAQDVPQPAHERQGRDEAAQGRAQRDEREGPLADLVGIEVVGEAPELGDDEVVEDADPDEEQDPHRLDGHAAGVQDVEDDEVGDEERSSSR